MTALGLVLVYWATPLELHLHLVLTARRLGTSPMLFAIALTPLLLEGTTARSAQGTGGWQYPLPA